VLSRKSSINKNSFYRSKGAGKVPDYLPNKPGVVGSRGQPAAPYNIRERKSRAGLNSGSGSGYEQNNLPALQSSGGVSANAYNNASSGGVKGLPSGGGGTKGASGKFQPNNFYKANKYGGLSGGIGSGIGSSAGNPYNLPY
jgi:hypothetical protein